MGIMNHSPLLFGSLKCQLMPSVRNSSIGFQASWLKPLTRYTSTYYEKDYYIVPLVSLVTY